MKTSKDTPKLLKNSGHRIIFKIVIGDEAYIPFYDVPTRQENRVWFHEDGPTPTVVKTQRAIKKVMYAVFFRSRGMAKTIKLDGQKTVTAKWCTLMFATVPSKNSFELKF